MENPVIEPVSRPVRAEEKLRKSINDSLERNKLSATCESLRINFSPVAVEHQIKLSKELPTSDIPKVWRTIGEEVAGFLKAYLGTPMTEKEALQAPED